MSDARGRGGPRAAQARALVAVGVQAPSTVQLVVPGDYLLTTPDVIGRAFIRRGVETTVVDDGANRSVLDEVIDVGPASSAIVSCGEAGLLIKLVPRAFARCNGRGLTPLGGGNANPQIVARQLTDAPAAAVQLPSLAWLLQGLVDVPPWVDAPALVAAAPMVPVGFPPGPGRVARCLWSAATSVRLVEPVTGTVLHTAAAATSHTLHVPVWARVEAQSAAGSSGTIQWSAT